LLKTTQKYQKNSNLTNNDKIVVKYVGKKGGSGHGGDLLELADRAGCAPDKIIDFSASINPLGPPEYLRKTISRSVEKLVHYPDPHGRGLLARLATILEADERQLVVANGSTEIIYTLPRVLDCKRAVIPVPAYLDYERAARLAGLEVLALPLSEGDDFQVDFTDIAAQLQDGDLVFLGRPNNPTGVSFAAAELLALAAGYPGVFFVVDESFFEFIDGSSGLISGDMAPNLIVIRSLTKFYAIPGLRLGFAAAAPVTADRLRDHIPSWTVNTIAQEVGEKVLGDPDYGERSRGYVSERRAELQGELAGISGIRVFPGEANYLLVRITRKGITARVLADRLLSHPYHIAIRVCDNFAGLDERFFRVAVRDRRDNEKLCEALAGELAPAHRRSVGSPRKTPALMLQGTASNAGKSVLTAALGRIFLQDGLSVAPFKAQNMSLNSFVTRDGGEMGRAQVVQAQACRLDPDIRMNPVLLKPSSDVGSQVIVGGRVAGNMSVEEYIRFKPEAARAALKAYDSLASEHDIMVIEGAGSPAEVNLKKHDIVNMAMARHAEARVLLVGDIDRGGVFASFIGSMEVMAEWERRLVAGFVVNRFRGRPELLADAFQYVHEFTGREVLGTIPYIKELGLPEEDSVSFKAGLYEKSRPAGDHVEIGVIDLPHISNFTDVEPFLAEPDVHLRIIRTAEELSSAADQLAALILPGSKNVITDLEFLRKSGIAGQIRKIAAEKNSDIVGICGGFQMLGKEIDDPFRIESDGGKTKALGVMKLTTTLAEEKTLTRHTGTHLPSGKKVHGYEIHHGRTAGESGPVIRLADGHEDGAISGDSRIWGSYLHGIFDDDDFRRWFIDRLRGCRNLTPLGRVVAPYNLEPAFDHLAEVVRESLDMNRIYQLLGL
jgi:cobyric acid synthase CobQ/L-threonine-O-3-phosphate decarboxylase